MRAQLHAWMARGSCEIPRYLRGPNPSFRKKKVELVRVRLDRKCAREHADSKSGLHRGGDFCSERALLFIGLTRVVLGQSSRARECLASTRSEHARLV